MKNLIILTLMAGLLGACKKDGELSIKLYELRTNRARWNGKNMVNYTMDESPNCNCMIAGSHRVVVDNNVVVSAVKDGSEVEHPEIIFKTVDQLFDYIESSLKKNPPYSKIEYDSKYGFPSTVYFDFDAQMADEEMGYQITNLHKTAGD